MADKTLEELQVELEAATGQLSKLRKENASYRVARNDALRKSHALQTIVRGALHRNGRRSNGNGAR